LNQDERQAIEWECSRLINLYANLNDQARWADVAALYAEDGLMTRPTAPGAPVVGRQAILDGFLARPPRASQHVVSNIVVDVESADTARAYSIILLFTGKIDPDGGRPLRDDAPPLVGSFSDRFVRTAEGWRFSERRGGLTFQ